MYILSIHATHNMAADISYTHISGNTYKITVRTYTNTNPTTTQVDRCELIIYFGDGDSVMAPRINGPSIQCTTADGVSIATYYKESIYETQYTYSGDGIYDISVEDPNRVAGICNIPNSVDASFYLYATLKISSIAVDNSSPHFTGIPMVTDTVGIVSYYTPALIENDADSLSYELVTPMAMGIPVSGYSLPTSSNSFSINPVTGMVIWDAPTMICNYVYAIQITEWRIVAGAAYNIGSTMQEVWNENVPYTGINENRAQLMTTVFPNPSSDVINFSISGSRYKNVTIKITNALGENIKEINCDKSSEVTTIKGLNPGIYFYSLCDSEGMAQKGKFVVSGIVTY